MKIFKSFALVMGLSFSMQSFALTDAQKKEFYDKGIITVLDENGAKKGHFEVRFMPGAENIKHDAKKAWDHAAALMSDLVKKEEFWHNVMQKHFMEGVNYAHQCCTDGVCSIPDQYCATVKKNAEIDGFGSNAAQLKNWLEFCGTCLEDVLVSAWGIGAGTVWAIAAPTASLLYRPIVAGTEAIVAGSIWPALAYSYNGVAYELVKNSAEPKNGDITVSFVPARHDSSFASDSCSH